MDIYRELIELNYLGTISLTKCVLPHMVKRKQGKIITVTSILGHVSMPVSSAYCASKHALRVRLLKLNFDRTDLSVYGGYGHYCRKSLELVRDPRRSLVEDIPEDAQRLQPHIPLPNSTNMY